MGDKRLGVPKMNKTENIETISLTWLVNHLFCFEMWFGFITIGNWEEILRFWAFWWNSFIIHCPLPYFLLDSTYVIREASANTFDTPLSWRCQLHSGLPLYSSAAHMSALFVVRAWDGLCGQAGVIALRSRGRVLSKIRRPRPLAASK